MLRRYFAGLIVLVAIFAVMLPKVEVRADVDTGLAYFRDGRFAEAYAAWRKAAEGGDAGAAFYLGVLYDTGEGIVADEAQALEWYRRAALGGSGAGAFNLAVMFDAGKGTKRDMNEAVVWYKRAAAAGIGRAAYNLGLIYESGDGVPPSRSRAISWFSRAAADGIAAARGHLGTLVTLPANRRDATSDLSMETFDLAQQSLLARGAGDAAKATALLQQAAAQHNPLAEYDLGYCYENGIGIASDLPMARSLYGQAAADATDPGVRSIALAALRGVESKIGRSGDAAAASPR